jgi:hypothetical protein
MAPLMEEEKSEEEAPESTKPEAAPSKSSKEKASKESKDSGGAAARVASKEEAPTPQMVRSKEAPEESPPSKVTRTPSKEQREAELLEANPRRRAPQLGPDRSQLPQRTTYMLTADRPVSAPAKGVEALKFGSLFAAPEQARCPEGRKLASVEAFKLEEMDKFFFGAGGYTCDRCGVHSDELGTREGYVPKAYASVQPMPQLGPGMVSVGKVYSPQCYRELVAEQDQHRKLELLQKKFYHGLVEGPLQKPAALEELKKTTDRLLNKPVNGFWSVPGGSKQAPVNDGSKDLSKGSATRSWGNVKNTFQNAGAAGFIRGSKGSKDGL